MSTTAHAGFDPAALHRGFAQRDAALLAALYAEDATVEIADAAHPPSAPERLRGRAEIRAGLERVCALEMTHELDIVAVGPDAVAFSLRCRYATGERVLCVATAQLRDGLITREVRAQAWDG